MSWNIQSVGKAEDVAAVAKADKYLPQPLKDAVVLFAEANPGKGFHLRTSGHYDKSYVGSGVSEFTIQIVTLATPPPKQVG